MYDVSVQTDVDAHVAPSPPSQLLQPGSHLSSHQAPLLGASQVLDHAASTVDASGDDAGLEAATPPAADWHEL